MVNPGGFKGIQKEFLEAQQELYNAAVEGNHVADTVADIQRRYFKRFPVTICHNKDPSEEFLAAVDDTAPDPEILPPSKDLSPSSFDCAQRTYELQTDELRLRKAVSAPFLYPLLNVALTLIYF